MESIRQLTLSLKPSILALVEVWNPKINVHIQGYKKPVFQLREKARGGGLAVWFQEKLITNELPSQAHKSEIETLTHKVTSDNHNFIHSLIYRPPSANIINSIHEIEEHLAILTDTGKPLIVTGDININIDSNINSRYAKKYLDVTDNYGLSQLITHPTRITATTATVIDHALTNISTDIEGNTISETIADHLPVLVTWKKKNSKKRRTNNEKPKHHPRTHINSAKLLNCLKNTDWTSWISNHSEVNAGFDSFCGLLNNTLSDCTETSTYRKRNSPKSSWIKPETIQIKILLNKERDSFLRNRSTLKENKLKMLNVKYKKALKKDKQDYYQNKLKMANNDNRKTWKIINEIIGRTTKKQTNHIFTDDNNKPIEDKCIAEKFNQHFIKLAPLLASTIPSPMKTHTEYLKLTTIPEAILDLAEITEQEIIDIIKSLKSTSSTGTDSLSNNTLKSIIPIIIKPLTHIINLSFQQGVFPDILKEAKIQPIFKADNPNCITNYRPISQLNPLSKCMERLAIKQLKQHLEDNKLLSNSQFGFREGYSTLHPLLLTINQLEMARNKKQYSILICLDLKKAFDTVESNKILPDKLAHYGCSSKTTKWFKDFFQNRRQNASWNNQTSSLQPTNNISVVQGSVLGPPAFNIYINELSKVTSMETFQFADDTNFIASGKNLHDLATKVNAELQHIADFFKANKLSLNTKKTVYMIIKPKGKSKTPENKIVIKIGDETIERANELTYLGVTFNDRLKFTSHIEKTIAKLKKGINALAMTKQILSFPARLNIYYALFHSHLSYCPLIWLHNISGKDMDRLTKLQKRAIRLLHKKRYRDPTEELFRSAKITKIKELSELQAITTVKQRQLNLSPKLINNLLKYNTRNTREQYRHNYIIPQKAGNIVHEMITHWNNSTLNIKTATTTRAAITKFKAEKANKQ